MRKWLLFVTLAGVACSPTAPPPATTTAPSPSKRAATTPHHAYCPLPQGGQFDGARFGTVEMVRICEHAYVDAQTSIEERQAMRRADIEALEHVEGALGEFRAQEPETFFCNTDSCRRYFAGTSPQPRQVAPHDRAPGATYVAGDRPALLITVLDSALNLVAHEMVHAELRARMGDTSAPIWWHEGIAASISDSPRCPGGLGRGIDDLRKLSGPREWAEQTETNKGLEIYCQARAEVETWGATDGKRKLRTLVESVAKGASFDATYGPMRVP